MRPLGGTVVVAAIALALSGCSGGDVASTDESLVGGLSAEERSTHEASLEQMAEFWNVEDPPSYEVVRWVLAEEADDVRADCMAESGFVRAPDGSYETGGQWDVFHASMYECFAKYPIEPKYATAWEETQIVAQYRWTVDVLLPCMAEHGVLVEDVPSEQVFVESWASSPYFPFAQVSDDQLPALEAACPLQQAPTAVLFEGVPPTEHPLARD